MLPICSHMIIRITVSVVDSAIVGEMQHDIVTSVLCLKILALT